jgi:hypothetical protein
MLFQTLHEIGSYLLQDALLNVPVVSAPDHEASVKSMNHDFVRDLGILSQTSRNEDTALPVNLFIGREGIEEFQSAEVIVIRDGKPVKAGGNALPFTSGVANQALLLAPDNHNHVFKQHAEPCGQVEASTVIETQLEVA